jgi:hypothetical protein
MLNLAVRKQTDMLEIAKTNKVFWCFDKPQFLYTFSAYCSKYHI